jgi:hypothetical protein
LASGLAALFRGSGGFPAHLFGLSLALRELLGFLQPLRIGSLVGSALASRRLSARGLLALAVASGPSRLLAIRGLLAVRGLLVLVGLLVGLLRRRLLVGLLGRRSAFRRGTTPYLLGGVARSLPSRRLALLFGELLLRMGLPGVTGRMSGLGPVFEAVSAPLRPLMVQLRVLAPWGLLLLRLGRVRLRLFRLGLVRLALVRLSPTRLLVTHTRSSVAPSRLLSPSTRLLVASIRLSRRLVCLLVPLRGALSLPVVSGLLWRNLPRRNLFPRNVIAFVSGPAAVSEGRVLLLSLELPGRGPGAIGVVPGGNWYVLALQALFHLRFDVLGTALFPPSVLSASLPVSVVSHR